MSNLPPAKAFTFIGAMVVIIACGYMQQRTLDKWTRQTGRAPMISKGRGSWAAYMKTAKDEMPGPVRKRIAMFGWAARVALFCALLLVVV